MISKIMSKKTTKKIAVQVPKILFSNKNCCLIKLFLIRKIDPIIIKIFNTLGNEFTGYELKKIFINREKANNIINQKIESFKNSLSSFLNTSLIKTRNNMMKNKLINKLPSRK